MDTVDFTMTITCLAAPFQAEGTVGNQHWYYRSRHGRWHFELDGEVLEFGTIGISSKASMRRILEILSDRIYRAAVKREDDEYDRQMEKL